MELVNTEKQGFSVLTNLNYPFTKLSPTAPFIRLRIPPPRHGGVEECEGICGYGGLRPTSKKADEPCEAKHEKYLAKQGHVQKGTTAWPWGSIF